MTTETAPTFKEATKRYRNEAGDEFQTPEQDEKLRTQRSECTC